MALKNRYFAIIYGKCLKGEPIRKIHKALYDETIRSKPQYASKYLLAMAIKLANRAKKLRNDDTGLLAISILGLFKQQQVSDKAKKLVNHEVQNQAEKRKDDLIRNTIEDNRSSGKWFYMASSHTDCAKDHLPYQGRLYVDEKAPEEVIQYAKSRGLYTVQWVMGAPAWFITRPNCRHYFVGLTEDQVRHKKLKDLRRTYHTHRREGDREFQTPRTIAIEEYTDRLHMLRGLYREYPTEDLKNRILKTEMLLKKWKSAYN